MRAVDSRGEMNQSAARLQSRRCRCDLGVCLWAYLRPLRNGQRAATIALAASGKSLKFGIVGSTIVHWLPQAAGMRCGRRDRQSHWSEHAHKQQNQHESGGQSMHGLQILLRRSDKQSVSGEPKLFSLADNRKTVYNYSHNQTSQNCPMSAKSLHVSREHKSIASRR
jgi:hypothetical protein